MRILCLYDCSVVPKGSHGTTLVNEIMISMIHWNIGSSKACIERKTPNEVSYSRSPRNTRNLISASFNLIVHICTSAKQSLSTSLTE